MAPGCAYKSGFRRKAAGGAHGRWRKQQIVRIQYNIMYDALEFYAVHWKTSCPWGIDPAATGLIR